MACLGHCPTGLGQLLVEFDASGGSRGDTSIEDHQIFLSLIFDGFKPVWRVQHQDISAAANG